MCCFAAGFKVGLICAFVDLKILLRSFLYTLMGEQIYIMNKL